MKIKGKIGARIFLENKGEFEVLTLQLVSLGESYNEFSLHFKAQRNTVESPKRFYALSVSHIEGKKELDFLNKMLKDLSGGWALRFSDIKVSEMIQWMEKKGIRPCVWDNRLCQFVSIEALSPDDWNQYSMVVPKCVSVVSENEIQARKQIEIKLLERGYKKELAQWIESGQKLENLGGLSVPCKLTFEDLK